MGNKKVLLKICGIRSQQEMEELVNLDIDYFGCIFASKSPRKVTVELATTNSQIAHSANKKVVEYLLMNLSIILLILQLLLI